MIELLLAGSREGEALAQGHTGNAGQSQDIPAKAPSRLSSPDSLAALRLPRGFGHIPQEAPAGNPPV